MINKALKGEVALIENAATDKRLRYRKELREEGVVSIIIVPIKAKDNIIGIMSLHSAVKRNFSDEEVMLIKALAQQGGLAIQNASLYLMLQQDMKELREDMWSHRSWF
jgi:GAF domain-containing protein